MKKTTIELQGKDTGLIFREDGKLELYLRSERNNKSLKPTNNEILTFVLSKLIEMPGWVEDQVSLYEDLTREEI